MPAAIGSDGDDGQRGLKVPSVRTRPTMSDMDMPLGGGRLHNAQNCAGEQASMQMHKCARHLRHRVLPTDELQQGVLLQAAGNAEAFMNGSATDCIAHGNVRSASKVSHSQADASSQQKRSDVSTNPLLGLELTLILTAHAFPCNVHGN
eukprot:330594-Chlamydomonas_euryale.AAC.7